MTTFTSYERFVVSEVAKNVVSPNPLQVALDFIGKPVTKLLEAGHSSNNKIVKKVVSTVDVKVEKSLRGTIAMGKKLTSDATVKTEYFKKHKVSIGAIEEIRGLSLREMDIVADTFRTSNGFFVTVEGVAMGAITTVSSGVLLPLAIAGDVTASMTLMSRHVAQIATSYGYSPADPMNIPHLLASMVPISSSSDEGFLSAKAAAFAEVIAAKRFAKKFTGELTAEVVEKSCPQLIKLMQKVAEKLGVVITQKELGMLLPATAALVNGGLNLAFQQMNHTCAKDYFRMQYLENKYGKEVAKDALTGEIDKARNKVS